MKKFLSALVLITASNYLMSTEISLTAATAISSDGSDYTAPVFSPDGKKIAYTGPKYKGIFVYDTEKNTSDKLTSAESSGYGFSFSGDSKAIVFLANENELKKIQKINLQTKKINDVFSSNKKVGVPYWHKNGEISFTVNSELHYYNPQGIFLRKIDGVKGHKIGFFNDAPVHLDKDSVKLKEKNIAIDGKCYSVEVSETAKKLLIHKIRDGHIYIVDLVFGGKIDLGEGYAGKFSPDGKWVIADVSKDDGHNITSSELWLLSVNGTERIQITNTPDKIEMYPSFSPDGREIVFSDLKSGKIFRSKIDIK